uniref:Uncharacterized protein n=1 Tax=Chromera velia CCMP2878 TaxID=1169474 RepID=A0A0G4HIK0_9ALVE|eukprot:Cvel_27979.t1-p1 / transcript=Cvel_27979.t1 / gene=Cvel_27979 / organism=Chromera_velia_CCMP2878 / gene_product=hypothetical protein / transcript_product=hypothetical protein / location=Cvel_scaffold3579:8917-9939(+) / protein_length=341 / sequence_SO=supercontig / SO=protein_coding / is_pseudo=false
MANAEKGSLELTRALNGWFEDQSAATESSQHPPPPTPINPDDENGATFWEFEVLKENYQALKDKYEALLDSQKAMKDGHMKALRALVEAQVEKNNTKNAVISALRKKVEENRLLQKDALKENSLPRTKLEEPEKKEALFIAMQKQITELREKTAEKINQVESRANLLVDIANREKEHIEKILVAIRVENRVLKDDAVQQRRLKESMRRFIYDHCDEALKQEFEALCTSVHPSLPVSSTASTEGQSTEIGCSAEASPMPKSGIGDPRDLQTDSDQMPKLPGPRVKEEIKEEKRPVLQEALTTSNAHLNTDELQLAVVSQKGDEQTGGLMDLAPLGKALLNPE